MKRAYKWIAFALCFAAFLLMGTESVSLTDRAVVLGLGIDKGETGYVVSAQIAMPAKEESKSAGYIVAMAEGSTVSGALDVLSREAGKLISMSHCNVVILGSGVIQHEAVSVLDYVVRNAYLSENAILLASTGQASDILSAKPAFSDMSSLYIQNMMMKFGYYPVRAHRNIKEFLVSYNTTRSANWIPIVSMTETEKPVSGEAGSESGEGNAEYLFDFTETAVFSGGNYVMKLPEECTRGINYVESVLEEGALTVTVGEAVYNFFIVRSKCKKSFSRDMTARFDIKLELILKEVITSGTSVPANISEPGERADLAVAEEVTSAVRAAYETCMAEGVDIFNLYDGFYGVFGDDWDGDTARANINIAVDLSYV